ncbi:MAG: UDP-glucose 4-epimerase GalE [Candidatus Metalachnospira sp.]|nr:UDP-glucose 4-epimerase GalE [Candidatus Metalachnospira sp.]
MPILLTGGTGFIGSHTAVELLLDGEQVIIADNLSNSSESIISKIKAITGMMPKLYRVDVSNKALMEQIFEENKINAVVHFAGFKAVGESVQKPIEYYRNNLDATLTLLEVMRERKVKKLIFSSSATVYGMSNMVPFTENMPTGGCTNPYGWTKYMIEQVLTDVAKVDSSWTVILLRYFNPIGAHESGLIGELPNGTPNNLLPYITQTAAGIREKLSVFGNDYPTKDGTGVRDYIHVVDLAKGHVAALQYAEGHTGTEIFNLGTGIGYSVLEIVAAFEKVTGAHVPYEVAPRRQGDIAECYASTEKAECILGWKAEKTIEDMCLDSWRWQQNCSILGKN